MNSMNIEQGLSYAIIGVFYFAYLFKQLHQMLKGIKTNQILRGTKPKRTRIIGIIMGQTNAIAILTGFYSIENDTHWFGGKDILIVGMCLATFGVIIFITAMVTMRDSWRAGINGDEKTELVISGIYRVSRNPAFLGFDLLFIGIFLAYPNMLHLMSTIFAVVMLHLQILEEEKFMERMFGDNYIEYRKKTSRYFKNI